jgi:hypothetical protein
MSQNCLHDDEDMADEDATISMKALSLPTNFEGRNSVIEARFDLLLLFLCPVTPTVALRRSPDHVLLYLHVLACGEGDDHEDYHFSAPYRILKFEYREFLDSVIDNRCVLPRRLFFNRLVKDLIPETLTVTVKDRSQFSDSHVKYITDFNTYFLDLYRNMKYQPYQMFLTMHYVFQHGLDVPLYLLRDVFDKFYHSVESTDPSERFHLLVYMARRYSRVSYDSTAKELRRFRHLVANFTLRSVDTYSRLNEISKRYSHEDSAGIVCSYALTKSFENLTPEDFVNGADLVTDKFAKLILYHEEEKFEELDREVRRGCTVIAKRAGELTRYFIKASADPLFAVNVKKVELQDYIRDALLEHYSEFPVAHLELKPTSILCELMAGVYDDDGTYGSETILRTRAFQPILAKWNLAEYRILTLNGLNIDRPIPKRAIESIRAHLGRPSIRSYVEYCAELLEHVSRSEYFYHETINPFLPIYTINADIDIYDQEYAIRYYQSYDEQWEVKEELFNDLKRLVLYVCRSVLRLPVDEANTGFYMYESVRDDLDSIGSAKFKLGIRLIVKFTTIAFINRSAVDPFLRILDIYRAKFPGLRQISDQNIFDRAIYGREHHEIRLPMNMKRDGSKALMPVLFACHGESFGTALRMTSSLVHRRNVSDNDAEIQYVVGLSVPTEEVLDKFDNASIYRNMFMVKGKRIDDEHDRYDSLKNVVFDDRRKDCIIDAIDRFALGRLTHRSNEQVLKLFRDTPLVYQGTNKFSWCSGIRFCAITRHENARGNPCNYYVRLSTNTKTGDGQRECLVYCHCFGTTCRERTRNFCIAKLLA